MKLQNKIIVKVNAGNEVIIFELRRPTDQEWNEFQAKRLDAGTGGRILKDNSNEARIDLFDKLLLSIENLEDDNGIITIDRKDAIPAAWKQDIVFVKIENEIRIDAKNS